MKKVKLCTLCLLVSILVNVPAFANNDRYGILNTSSTEVVASPRANITYGAMVIAKGQRGYFTNNGNSFYVSAGKNINFTYRLAKNATVQVGFYNSNTGTYNALYYGTILSNTVTYSSQTSSAGYFYIYNLSNGSITVSGATVTY